MKHNREDEKSLTTPTLTSELSKVDCKSAKTASVSNSGSNSNVCRICFSGEEDGKLNKYCLCMGSIEHCHQSCLVRWIQESGIHKCELCGYNYHLVIRSSWCWRWRCPPVQPNEHFFLAIYTVAWLTLAGSILWLSYVTYGDDPLYRESELATVIYGVYGMIAVASTSIIIVETSCVVWPHLLTMYRLNQQTVIIPISTTFKSQRRPPPLLPPSRRLATPFSRRRLPISSSNIFHDSLVMPTTTAPPITPMSPGVVLHRLYHGDGRLLSSPNDTWVHQSSTMTTNVLHPYAFNYDGRPINLDTLEQRRLINFGNQASHPIFESMTGITSRPVLPPRPPPPPMHTTRSGIWIIDWNSRCVDQSTYLRSSNSTTGSDDSTDSFFTSVSAQSISAEFIASMDESSSHVRVCSTQRQITNHEENEQNSENNLQSMPSSTRHYFSDTKLLVLERSNERN